MTVGFNWLKASDGTGNAVLATVTSNRLAGATVLDVNSVDNWPTEFICTVGTLLGTNFIDPATVTEFRGHIVAGDIIIDGFEPGSVDVGNTIGQVAMVKQTTGWPNNLIDTLKVSLNDDGTFKNNAVSLEAMFADAVDPVLRDKEASGWDYVASGGVWTGDGYGANRNASMTALVAYINGQRGTVAAVAARTFTASKDTYVDVLNTAGVFTLVYTEVANNAASPALAANSIRIAIIVTGAANIANVGSINQGQHDKVLPIASTSPYCVTDSLGNMIYNTSPIPRLIGYRQIIADFATAATTPTQIPGFVVPFKIPSAFLYKRVETTIYSRNLNQTAGTNPYPILTIYDGSIGGTKLNSRNAYAPGGNQFMDSHAKAMSSPSGTKTYYGSLHTNTGTAQIVASADAPAYMSIEVK